MIYKSLINGFVCLLMTLCFFSNGLGADGRSVNPIVLKNPEEIQLTGDNSIGKMLMDNPNTPLTIESDRLSEVIDRYKSIYKQNILTDSVFSPPPNDCVVNSPEDKYSVREAMPHHLQLAGGCGSLDRLTSLTFIFVEGNGDPVFDWNVDTVNYLIFQTFEIKDSFEEQARQYGIELKITTQYVYVEIDYEPALMTNGEADYNPYDVNGLDTWRSAAMGELGYEENLRGLFKLNMKYKGDVGCAEGGICFLINMGDYWNQPGGGSSSWAAGWDPNIYTSGGFCTVANRNLDYAEPGVMAHELLHLFGAADEYIDGYLCENEADCNEPSGELCGLTIFGDAKAPGGYSNMQPSRPARNTIIPLNSRPIPK